MLSAAGTLGTHFPPSFAWLAAQNRKCIVGQGLTDFGSAQKRSVSFRNFPKLSVSFRFVPKFSVSFRLVPGAWCLLPIKFAWLAAQNRKCIVLQGLTDFGPVAERSVSFRNFPKLSVSFRFVPLCWAPFRWIRSGPRPFRRVWAYGPPSPSCFAKNRLRRPEPARVARPGCRGPQLVFSTPEAQSWYNHGTGEERLQFAPAPADGRLSDMPFRRSWR